MNSLFNKMTKSFAPAVLALGLAAQLVLSPNAFAEDGGQKTVTLTVEKAVDYAKKNSRALKSADIDLDIKRRASA